MNKKKILLISLLIISVLGILFIKTGFTKQTDVYLDDYTISEDGGILTLKTSIASSIGYTRTLKVKHGGDNLYITFYPTFGLNNPIGSKNTFPIEITPLNEAIYFYSGNGGYKLILKKNPLTNHWDRPQNLT